MGLGAAAPAVNVAAPVAATKDAVSFGSQVGGPTGLKILMSAPGASGSGLTNAVNTTKAVTTGGTALQGGGAQFTGGLGSRFAQATRAGLPAGTPGFISKAVPMAAGMGALSNVSSAMTPSMGSMGSDGVIDNSYQGPYTAQKRTPSFAKDTSEILDSSKERRYFDVGMPEVYNMQGQIVQPGSSTARGTPILQNVLNPNAKKGQNRYSQIFTPYMTDPEEEGYADGGEIELADGAFVLDARTVSEMGNGSSNAGMEALRRIGGRPIKGPGDGVSDSIPARIGRDQPARVARDEVVIPAEAVRRIGKGNQKRGADKLYALMDKAHKARKKAKRGQDTKLRRGLV
jgi:hypothetical protein